MSEPAVIELPPAALARVRSRVLNYYAAIIGLCLVTIGIMVAYAISLGPLIGPGVEESFGLDLSVLFLVSALLVHILDRTYREWPLGRRPVVWQEPSPITSAKVLTAIKVVAVLAAAALIAYLIAGLLT